METLLNDETVVTEIQRYSRTEDTLASTEGGPDT